MLALSTIIGLRHPFDVGPEIEARRILVQQLGAEVVARRAGQQVVAEVRIVVETEIVERVGQIQPDLVRRRAVVEDAAENRSARSGFDALVNGSVGVGDVASSECAVETLQLVADVGAIGRELPGVIGPLHPRSDLIGRGGLRLDAGEGNDRVPPVHSRFRRNSAPRRFARCWRRPARSDRYSRAGRPSATTG